MPYTYITSYVLYWKENLDKAARQAATGPTRPDRALLVMVKSFASYELCMAFLVVDWVPVCGALTKVDKFTCADNHADFKASNIYT